MDKENMIKGICKLQLNSVSTVDNDPTLLKCTYSILDFNESGNKQIVPKELALEAAPTLKGKPLLCVYSPNTSNTTMLNDHFNGHGEMIKKDRYGNEYIGTNSIAIGSALEGGYLGTIKDDNGNDMEVLMCDFYVWCDRNIEIVQLMQEIYENGLPLFSSCEYWYSNFEVNNGVQTLKSPLIFSGHCVLGSGENGSVVVAPAYDSSKLLSINEKFNKAISQAIAQEQIDKQNNSNQNQKQTDIDINKNSQKEDDGMSQNTEMFKKVCELSFDDIRTGIYKSLKAVLSEDEYYDSWINECYETYFILSYWLDSTHKYFKVTYSKENEVVTIDWENRIEVFLYQEWREIPAVQTEISSLNEKIGELTVSMGEKDSSIQTLNTKIETLTTEKSEIVQKFNSASDTIVSLNSKVEEMKPIVEEHNKELYEKALNEKKDFYLKKFNSVKAVDKFETEEVQELIKKTLNEDEEGKKAVLELNSMIVELVPVEEVKIEDKPKEIKEFNSKMNNLIPTENDFESRYGFK